jgi:hypothetical protein
MRFIIFFQILVVTGFTFSCGESDESSSDDEEKRTDFITTENEFIDHTHPDSLLKSYISMREEIIFNTYGDSETEGFSISGKLFFEKDGYFIVNIEETWDQYSYPIALVINSNETSNFIEGDGMYTEISDFIDNYLNCDYNVYSGSFIEGPAYNVGDNTPFLLEKVDGYRAEMSSRIQLCLYDGISKIMTTNVVAKSTSDGDCIYEAVHSEKFVLGSNKSRIEIERTETHRDGCEDLFSVTYSKIWTYDEYDLSSSFPQYFKGEYVSDVDFGNVPTVLYQIRIDGADTFRLLDHTRNILEYREINGPAPMYYTMDERTSWDRVEHLIVGFSQLNEDEFVIYQRGVGQFNNGGESINDGNALNSSESSNELFVINVQRDGTLYKIYSVYSDKTFLFTSDINKYPELDLVEEI